MSTQVHADLTEAQVEEISESLGEPEWLLETRLEALEALDDLAMPDVIRTPGRDWTNLDALDYETLVDPLDWAQEKDRVSAEGVDVLDWSSALEQHGDLIEDHFGSVVDPQRDYLTALSTALFAAGTVVYVPEGVDAEDVKIRTRMNSRSLFNYTLVVAEESASVTILERQGTGDAIGGERYYSGIVEAVAGENAHVQYGSLQDLSEETYNFQVKRGHAGTYGQVNWIEGNIGSRLTKTSVETRLLGDASESKIVGAFFGHNDQHFDIGSRVWHEAEHTTADLVTRGVLDDQARSVYEGVQDVGREAWDTNSYQRENTLMLSDESEADASPKLIINNHDTEASHSATVGQVDKQDLFYMTSRGVGEQRAKNMLVEGFFVPVLEEVAVDELRDDLEENIAARLRQ
ncbi:Fe-S cluster assembly protein SufD [Halobacteriales archaeon Cl-PHB]